jgi:hypothetical protein
MSLKCNDAVDISQWTILSLVHQSTPESIETVDQMLTFGGHRCELTDAVRLCSILVRCRGQAMCSLIVTHLGKVVRYGLCRVDVVTNLHRIYQTALAALHTMKEYNIGQRDYLPFTGSLSAITDKEVRRISVSASENNNNSSDNSKKRSIPTVVEPWQFPVITPACSQLVVLDNLRPGNGLSVVESVDAINYKEVDEILNSVSLRIQKRNPVSTAETGANGQHTIGRKRGRAQKSVVDAELYNTVSRSTQAVLATPMSPDNMGMFGVLAASDGFGVTAIRETRCCDDELANPYRFDRKWGVSMRAIHHVTTYPAEGRPVMSPAWMDDVLLQQTGRVYCTIYNRYVVLPPCSEEGCRGEIDAFSIGLKAGFRPASWMTSSEYQALVCDDVSPPSRKCILCLRYQYSMMTILQWFPRMQWCGATHWSIDFPCFNVDQDNRTPTNTKKRQVIYPSHTMTPSTVVGEGHICPRLVKYSTLTLVPRERMCPDGTKHMFFDQSLISRKRGQSRAVATTSINNSINTNTNTNNNKKRKLKPDFTAENKKENDEDQENIIPNEAGVHESYYHDTGLPHLCISTLCSYGGVACMATEFALAVTGIVDNGITMTQKILYKCVPQKMRERKLLELCRAAANDDLVCRLIGRLCQKVLGHVLPLQEDNSMQKCKVGGGGGGGGGSSILLPVSPPKSTEISATWTWNTILSWFSSSRQTTVLVAVMRTWMVHMLDMHPVLSETLQRCIDIPALRANARRLQETLQSMIGTDNCTLGYLSTHIDSERGITPVPRSSITLLGSIHRRAKLTSDQLNYVARCVQKCQRECDVLGLLMSGKFHERMGIGTSGAEALLIVIARYTHRSILCSVSHVKALLCHARRTWPHTMAVFDSVCTFWRSNVGVKLLALSPETMSVLRQHKGPGNGKSLLSTLLMCQQCESVYTCVQHYIGGKFKPRPAAMLDFSQIPPVALCRRCIGVALVSIDLTRCAVATSNGFVYQMCTVCQVRFVDTSMWFEANPLVLCLECRRIS